MKIEFDPAKNTRNTKERGLPFARVAELGWDQALIYEDTHKDYPERRFIAHGLIGDCLHVVVFTPVNGDIRVINFRKANKREVEAYASNRSTNEDTNGSRGPRDH